MSINFHSLKKDQIVPWIAEGLKGEVTFSTGTWGQRCVTIHNQQIQIDKLVVKFFSACELDTENPPEHLSFDRKIQCWTLN